MPHIPAHIRKWIYGITLAGIPLLVVYGIVDESAAPLWVALVGAILAPGLALANITPDPTAEEYWAGVDEHTE